MTREIGNEHVTALKRYIEGLRSSGEGLPSRSGKLNISAVALACGFNREVIYQNPHCRALLQEAAKLIGLRGVECKEEQAEVGKVRLERRITQLEQQNAALVAEVFDLRRKLEQLRHIEEMFEEGKRVIP
jgi:hypothetical protein